MKKLIIHDLLILSFTQRGAIKVSFDPKRNVILGLNGMGKSCLIKTIYSTLGADVMFHDLWSDLSPLSLLRFSVDGKDYSIMKQDSAYRIFDSENKLLKVCRSVTKELGPLFSTMFNFKIQMNDQHQHPRTLPPAYLFLPFYIDQDVSWQKNWSAFNRLTQFPSWRTPVIEYHLGIRGAEYYEAKIKIDTLNQEIKGIGQKVDVLKAMLEDVKSTLSKIQFDVDMESFKQETNELLAKCQILNKAQDKYKSQLVPLYETKIALESQIKIANDAHKEKKEDYSRAFNAQETVECPKCHRFHENSFSERFAIAQDESQLYELLLTMQEEITEVNIKIEDYNKKFDKNAAELKEVQEVLNYRQQEIELRDVIKSEGKKEMRDTFERKIQNETRLLGEHLAALNALNEELKQYDNSERKKEIKNLYLGLMQSYLAALDVENLKEDSYKEITTIIKDSGSSKPRSLMAYYFSIFQVMQKYSTSTFCPIVIDSPNQQAQDDEHLPKIYDFIHKNQPNDSQLILGSEEHLPSYFGGKVIELKSKNRLLQEDKFDEVYAEIKPYLDEGVFEAPTSLF